jgi:hypothetical protein
LVIHFKFLTKVSLFKIVSSIQTHDFLYPNILFKATTIISINQTQSTNQMLKMSSILFTSAFPNMCIMFHHCNSGYTGHLPDMHRANGRRPKTLNISNNNPLLTSDKTKNLLISEATHVVMLYCHGETALCAVYSEPLFTNSLKKNLVSSSD